MKGMSIRTLIDGGLQYLTNRRTDNTEKKPTKRQDKERCRACGGSIVEVNIHTHRKACIKCGKEAI